MSDFFIGEIRLFPYKLIPAGWLACNGQILQIGSNPALFSLLGTQFGGNGTTTFQLPNLNGRAIVGNNGAALGMPPNVGNTAGAETVTLTINQMPVHNHRVKIATQQAALTNTAANPTNSYFAGTSIPTSVPNPPASPPALYSTPNSNLTSLSTSIITETGGSAAHENRQPFLALSYCIAAQGIYPPRN